MSLSGTAFAHDAPVLVTGALGMLGRDVVAALRARRYQVVPTVREVSPRESATMEGLRPLDITSPDEVRTVLQQVRPAAIVNCAAYTRVDEAERDYSRAFETNAAGVGTLARCAAEIGSVLVQISTDYVFGGELLGRPSSPQADAELRESAARMRAGTLPPLDGVRLADEFPAGIVRPYREDDAVHPCGIYGHSKRFGEELARASHPDGHLILRTSWLYGPNGTSFVATMLRLGAERKKLTVVNDQFGSPTWTPWLAETIVALIERGARGTFHAAGHGGISWFEFAQEILAQAGLPAQVEPQTTAELGRPAPRPPFSVLDVSKLEECIGAPCPEWREDLKRHLKRISWNERRVG